MPLHLRKDGLLKSRWEYEYVKCISYHDVCIISLQVDDKGVAEFNKLMDEKTYKQRIAK